MLCSITSLTIILSVTWGIKRLSLLFVPPTWRRNGDYYENRINFEVFHALTDGTGATEFLRELVKNYLYLAHKEEGLPKVQLAKDKLTVQDQEK